MIVSVKRLKHLKRVMESYLKDSADFDLDNNFRPGSKEERFFHYGYGIALKDVLKSFHLIEKEDIKDNEKDILEIINRIKFKYPTVIANLDNVSNFVPEFMAHLEMDVFNLPKDFVMESEDLADKLSFDFFKKTNLTIIILFHTEEETRRCYPEILSGK